MSVPMSSDPLTGQSSDFSFAFNRQRTILKPGNKRPRTDTLVEESSNDNAAITALTGVIRCIDPEADTGSDHVAIRFEITTPNTPSVPDPRSQRYNWKKADWENVTKYLQEHTKVHNDRWKLLMAHSHHQQNLDTAAELLRDAILAA